MQSIRQIAKDLKGSSESISNLSKEEQIDIAIESLNKLAGELHLYDGYECPKCNNKGILFFRSEITGKESSGPCTCMKIRRSIRRMKKSGLEKVISQFTFDNYLTEESWQQSLKESAQRFVRELEKGDEYRWLFMGGGVGSGKTHLCTAMSRELLLQGKEVMYMRWMDYSTNLKANKMDAENYIELMNPLKDADVLYIDDLFKGEQGKRPTPADINLAYEILNHRYMDQEKVTIISCEYHLPEILGFDNGVGSRIYEKAKKNTYNISKDDSRNYRLRDMKLI